MNVLHFAIYLSSNMQTQDRREILKFLKWFLRMFNNWAWNEITPVHPVNLHIFRQKSNCFHQIKENKSEENQAVIIASSFSADVNPELGKYVLWLLVWKNSKPQGRFLHPSWAGCFPLLQILFSSPSGSGKIQQVMWNPYLSFLKPSAAVELSPHPHMYSVQFETKARAANPQSWLWGPSQDPSLGLQCSVACLHCQSFVLEILK